MKRLGLALAVALLALPGLAQFTGQNGTTIYPRGVHGASGIQQQIGIKSTPGWTALRLGLDQTGPLLPEDSGTVSHVYWDGAQLVETTPPSTLRTNYSPALSTWSAGLVGTPTPTLSLTAAQADPVGGTNAYRAVFAGNTDAANESALWRHQTIAAPAATGTYTFSLWMKTNDASTKTIPISWWNGVASYVVGLCTVTPSWGRCSSTGTLSAGGGLLLPGIGWYNNGAYAGGTTMVDADLSVYGPQLEAGSSATDLIVSGAGATSVPVYSGTTPLAWTMNGTVPQVAANVSPFVPGKPGAGPYSAANSYQGPTTLGEWQGDWSVTVVAKFGDTASVEYIYGKYPSTGTGGWILYKGGSGNIINYVYDGALKGASCPGAHIVGGISVITFGRSGGTNFCRMNGGASGSVAAGAALSASAEPIRIGRYGGAGYAITTTIYEILASTTPYSDALHAARFNAVFGLLPGPVTVTRADPVTYTANGFVWSAPPATMGIGASGAEVWKGSTNYVLQSGTLSTGTAATTPWTLTAATVATVAGDPVGGNWAEVTSTANTGAIYSTATTPASTVLAGSVVASRSSGTGTATVIMRGATSASGCWCSVVDLSTNSAVACTPLTGIGPAGTAAQDCWVRVTVGTSPLRISAGGTTASTVSPTLVLAPGDMGVSTGTTRFSLAQIEVGTAYPTPYIATTGTATARAASVPSVPLPTLGNRWCISVAATPGSGSTWTTGAGALSTYLFSNYPASLSDSMWLATGGGFWNFIVYDSAGNIKTASYAHGLGATSSTQRITVCNNNGATAIYKNGVLGATGSGAGTAIQTVTRSPLYLGLHNSGSQFDGSISNLKVCKGATKASECR